MLKIGHRGARAYEPENTLRSFKRAIELGVDAVEFDVRKTKDNELVIIHNSNVNKTTNGTGTVNDLTLKQIKSFVTDKGEQIPTLEEVLDFVSNRVKLFVEIKETGIEKKVLDLINRKAVMENVVVISFLEDVLRNLRKLNENIEIGLIYVRHKNPINLALELKANEEPYVDHDDDL